MPYVTSSDILPAAFSDHQAAYLELSLPGNYSLPKKTKFYTYWKLNNAILDHEDFLENFEDLYTQTKEHIPDYPDICD